jgi:hypothetical protein
MAFDPDAFLAGSSQPSGSFDPDAFLAGQDQPSYAMKTSTGFPEPQAVDQPQKMTAGPTPEDLMSLSGGYGMGQLAGMGASGVASLFEKTPTLINAGIKPATILRMTPKGMNPAVFGANLEDDLNDAGAIGKNASETWQNMNTLANQAGQRVGSSLQAIQQAAGPNAVTVDAGTALQPVVDGWAERASGAVSGTRRLAVPFEQAHQALIQQAAQQGGQLTLDNVRSVMDEIGPLVHKGPEATQEAYSELYGALADARDGMVQRVAQQARNPQLAQNLLDANADYSKYMRLMPDINKAASAYPIKEGVSMAQKVVPYLERGAGIYAGYEGAKKLFGQ